MTEKRPRVGAGAHARPVGHRQPRRSPRSAGCFARPGQPAPVRCRRAAADDWERAQLAPRVTMSWDAAPVAGRRGGTSAESDRRRLQIDAKRRFHAAVASAGPGLADILWRVVCAGEGMREAETALGWPARAGKLVLTFALDRRRGLLPDQLRVAGKRRHREHWPNFDEALRVMILYGSSLVAVRPQGAGFRGGEGH